MRNLHKNIVHFLKEENATTSIEYALIGTLVAIAIITGVSLLGDNLNTLYFKKVSDEVAKVLAPR